MILPRKSLAPPKQRERVMRLDAKMLEASARVRDFALLSLKREGEVLVPAGGAEKVGNAGGNYTDMFFAGGTVFARRSDNIVDTFPVRKGYSFGDYEVLGAAAYAPVKGKTEYFLPASDRLYRLYDDTYEVMAEPAGGSCIAVHHERLFLASGSKLSYSAPLASDKWLLTGEDTGEIDLSPVGGDILELCPYDGRLYVFRENEILEMRADANDVNFRFVKVNFNGRPLAKSVRCVGEGIVFQTKRGLCYLTESGCKFVRAPCMAKLLPQAAAWEGRYYALAERGETKCIYVYDPARDEEYLLNIPAALLTGGTEGVYFVHGTAVYRLTDNGLPDSSFPGEGAGTLEVVLDAGSDAGGVKRYLSAITVLGEGTFAAQFEADGLTRTAEVKAGMKTRVMQLLYTGTLKFSLRTIDKTASVRTILLHFGEDGA